MAVVTMFGALTYTTFRSVVPPDLTWPGSFPHQVLAPPVALRGILDCGCSPASLRSSLTVFGYSNLWLFPTLPGVVLYTPIGRGPLPPPLRARSHPPSGGRVSAPLWGVFLPPSCAPLPPVWPPLDPPLPPTPFSLWSSVVVGRVGFVCEGVRARF